MSIRLEIVDFTLFVFGRSVKAEAQTFHRSESLNSWMPMWKRLSSLASDRSSVVWWQWWRNMLFQQQSWGNC